MEGQFDGNQKFKDKINEKTAEEMRFQPIGRDKHGLAHLNKLLLTFEQVTVNEIFEQVTVNTRAVAITNLSS